MGFTIQFDARTVAPNVTPEPIPTAIYTAAIIASEEKGAKNTPGATYYELTEQILEGEFKGRKLTDRLNCKNPNQTAVDIAYGTLSAICHVTGVLQLNNSQELHGKPFKINVVKVPRNDDPTRMTNEIRGYLHLDGTEPGKQGMGAAPTAVQTPAFNTGANGPTPTFTAPPPAGNGAPSFQPQPIPTLAQPAAITSGYAPAPNATQSPEQVPPVVQQQPAPTMQYQPAPQPAPAPAPQPVQIFQKPDGSLVNANGQPVDPYGNLLAAAPIPQQYQPAPQPTAAPQNGQPSATPSWAQ